MISVTITKSNHKIVAIEATGHSGYAEAGNDIVCSAVSVLLENLINGLTEVVKISPQYIVDEEKPYLSVKIPNNLQANEDEKSQILMQTTCLGIKNVADGYSKFIKIKEKQHD